MSWARCAASRSPSAAAMMKPFIRMWHDRAKLSASRRPAVRRVGADQADVQDLDAQPVRGESPNSISTLMKRYQTVESSSCFWNQSWNTSKMASAAYSGVLPRSRLPLD